MVPTDETARQKFFLKMYLQNEIPVMFLGPTYERKNLLQNKNLIASEILKYIFNLSFIIRINSGAPGRAQCH